MIASLTKSKGRLRDFTRVFCRSRSRPGATQSHVFQDRLGMLMVRSTLEDLDAIQQVLSKFTAPVRQVLLEVKVAEFRGDAVGIRSAPGHR